MHFVQQLIQGIHVPVLEEDLRPAHLEPLQLCTLKDFAAAERERKRERGRVGGRGREGRRGRKRGERERESGRLLAHPWSFSMANAAHSTSYTGGEGCIYTHTHTQLNIHVG